MAHDLINTPDGDLSARHPRESSLRRGDEGTAPELPQATIISDAETLLFRRPDKNNRWSPDPSTFLTIFPSFRLRRSVQGQTCDIAMSCRWFFSLRCTVFCFFSPPKGFCGTLLKFVSLQMCVSELRTLSLGFHFTDRVPGCPSGRDFLAPVFLRGTPCQATDGVQGEAPTSPVVIVPR